MAKHAHARAPKGAVGTRRNRDRPQGWARPAWLRPFRLADRALAASQRLIDSTRRAVDSSLRCAHRRPIHASKKLQEVSALLVTASQRLLKAAQMLDATNRCIARDPAGSLAVPELLGQAFDHWLLVAEQLTEVSAELFALQEELLRGLRDGTLVAEAPAERRPRIVLEPRPAPVRAFLRARQRRVADRISAILRRRRHIRRPAALTPPPATDQGRAPPLSPVCPF